MLKTFKILLASVTAAFVMSVAIDWKEINPILKAMWAIHVTSEAQAANNPSNVNYAPSIATMQALGAASSLYPTLTVLGTQGAGSIFNWVVGSLPCNAISGGGDKGTTFCATNGAGGYITTGYWKRQFNTINIPAEWFGAVLGSESGSAINAALAYTAVHGGCTVLQGSGQDYLTNQIIEFGGNNVVNCLLGTGPGQAGIIANSNNLDPLVRIDGEFDRIENITAAGGGKTGGSGFGFVPQNESQTSTLINMDHIHADNLFATGFANDGFRWRTGPNVSGSDSALYRGYFGHLQAANDGICFHVTESVNAGGGVNDNDFVALSCENTGVGPSHGMLFDLNANAQANRIHGIECEGITTSPGICLEFDATNASNTVFGFRAELVTDDIYNNAANNKVYGYSPSGFGNNFVVPLAILSGEGGSYSTVQNEYMNHGSMAAFSTSANGALKMGGYGSSWKITPNNTGNVYVTVFGTCSDSAAVTTALANSIVYGVNYGTGTAPTQGAANTGTSGTTEIPVTSVSFAGAQTYCAIDFEATGLTLGTAYWFDWAMYSLTSGTATFQPSFIWIREV